MSLPDEKAPHTNGAAPPLSDEALRRLAEAIRTHSAEEGVGLPEGEARTFGRFLLRRVIGQGRFGIVFLADDPDEGQVALKLPQPGVLLDPALAERFRRDAEAAAHLEHPGIVPVLDAGTLASVPYIVMPYVPGPTLAAWLETREGPVPVADAVDLLIALADAVQHAHERGVLHCDLKPANVLLHRPGRAGVLAEGEGLPRRLACEYEPKVTDFGLARLLCLPADETRTHLIAGTPPYMAPEQARGTRRDLTYRCDVHALAVILYQLLTGGQPYPADSDAERLRQLVDPDVGPTRPRSLRRGLPRDLEAIVQKGMEKEPARRYGSAKSLADDLHRFRDGRPTLARPVGVLGRAARWARRRPALAAMMTVCVGMAVAAAYLVGLIAVQRFRHAQEMGLSERGRELQEFHATFERVRTRRLEQPDGWADENLTDLRRLAAMTPAAENLPALRTEAAAALAAPRLRMVRELGVGKNAYACAFSPDGETLALGERYPVLKSNELRVWLVRTTGEDVGELRYEVDRAWEARYGGNRADGARSLVYSPDGRWLVLGTRSGRLVCWDLREKRQEKCWPAHQADGAGYIGSEVRSLLFNRDGSVLLSGSQGGYVSSWDARDGWKALTRSPGILPVGTPSVRELAWVRKPADPDSLWHFDPRRGSLSVLPWAKIDRPVLVCQTSDGERLAASTNLLGINRSNRLGTHRLGTNRLLLRPGYPPEQLLLWEPAHLREKAAVNDMAFSPDGRWLWFALKDPDRIELWDAVSGTPVGTSKIRGESDRLAAQTGGRQVAVAGKGGTPLFEPREGSVRRTLVEAGEAVWFALSPDGERLLVAAGNAMLFRPGERAPEKRGPLTLYQRTPEGFTWLRHLIPPSPHVVIRQVALPPQGKGLDLAYHGSHFYGLGVGVGAGLTFPASRWLQTTTCHDLQFGPDGAVWVAEAGKLIRWPGEGGGQVVSTVVGEADRAGVCFEVLRPDQVGMLAGRGDGKLERFDAGGNRLGSRDVFGDQAISSLAMKADGSEVLVGGSRGAVARLALPTDEVSRPQAPQHREAVVGVEYLQGGVTLTASGDHSIRLWDTHGRPLLTLREGGPISRVALSPGGAELYVLVRGEWGLRVWDLAELHEGLRDLGLEPGFSVTRQAPPQAAPPTGGLVAELFYIHDLEYLLLRRRDPQVNFDWGKGAPWDIGAAADNFSARWTGWLHATKPGEWEFQLDCDDEGTLWLDGRLALTKNGDHPPAYLPQATVRLPDQPVSFRLDYIEHKGVARCRLLWRPAGSKGPFVPVPPEAFTPD